jgi:hypothetical protein
VENIYPFEATPRPVGQTFRLNTAKLQHFLRSFVFGAQIAGIQVTSDTSLKGYPMRRLLQLLLMVLIVTASATGVRASTDCERWFVAYKQELAHAKAVQRIQAAKRRARRKLAGYVKPKPVNKPKLVHVVHRPPMNRSEMLRKFNLACGVLPEDSADEPLVSEETPVEFASERPLDDGLGLIPGQDGPLLPLNDPPPFAAVNGPSGGGPPIY